VRSDSEKESVEESLQDSPDFFIIVDIQAIRPNRCEKQNKYVPDSYLLLIGTQDLGREAPPNHGIGRCFN
ncbi:MAG: hypothetical protein MPK06_02010, partial [Alphaproteobacteria bacterium]|nr:hypothetical protein [Alphaproteobacteria bacterium]MDA8005302.1 hypothetical protein [Alphaproteobacteria bacterium]